MDDHNQPDLLAKTSYRTRPSFASGGPPISQAEDFEKRSNNVDNNLDRFKGLKVRDTSMSGTLFQPYDYFERGWKQPRFIPSSAYDRQLAKERMLTPQIGGRSKKAQLGSIEESWGSGPKVSWLGEAEERKGMFELEEDPPSRNISPFREVEEGDNAGTQDEDAMEGPMEALALEQENRDPRIEIEKKRQEFLANARRGTNFESTKDLKAAFVGRRDSVELRMDLLRLHDSDEEESTDNQRFANFANPEGQQNRKTGVTLTAPEVRRDEEHDDQLRIWISDNRRMMHEQTPPQFDGRPYHAFEYDHSKSQNARPPHGHDRHSQVKQQSTSNGLITPTWTHIQAGESRHQTQAQGSTPTLVYSQSADYAFWLRRADGGSRRRG
ncbi:uncharacterized protein I303_102255 [Kwoniella dejecticola CBS 10117]|uniref:Uncharacterized protein n=1 Tax=Kwoniella dejecticola CBS 10117 TaxID=1296121 RepID=A0A1A6ABH5_9TREE|nr:uncharacterized protein I303_01605 [Kwoniella dejecticola CBS 10117]OBR87403.1 hypothetical protein I303_01605 [Kwoniella dejecticola CBS 10117]